MLWYALGALLTTFLFWSWSLCQASAKEAPKPPRRKGWHTDENGPYWN
jgi:hypothetical protein